MSGGRYGVGVIGCGLIGRRRATVAAAHARTEVVAVVDTDLPRAESLAAEVGCAARGDWRGVVEDPRVDVVVVATPNGYLAEIGRAALDLGKHVLLEKPMGRNLREAEYLAAGVGGGGPVLKIGFNHRYHPAISALLAAVRAGEIGRVIGIRGRYGHGGRPGCEREWRGDPELAGGGHLLDQGVHLADLIHGVAGVPERAVGFLQTAVWPVAPLEDNAYGIFHFRDGVVAQFHVSMTQWKNLFSFEVTGETGALVVEGLGGSYGEERLVRVRRRMEGGVPTLEEELFPGPDRSWSLEWDEFVASIESGAQPQGGAEDGLAAMRMIDALYRSAARGEVVVV